jgi:hypothetical protein
MRDKIVETDRQLSDVEEKVAARHKGDALFEWFLRSSDRLWKSIEPTQNFFRAQMKRGKRINNPFLGIGFLLTVFITGLLTVGLLSLVVAPVLQIILVLIAMVATVCRGLMRLVGGMR